MSDYTIKKGIPPPCHDKTKTRKYPWLEMQPGDCFDVPKDESHAARRAAGAWKASHIGWAFTCKSLASGMCRIWLVQRPGYEVVDSAPVVRPEVLTKDIQELETLPVGVNVAARLREISRQQPTGIRTHRMK